MRRIVAHGQHLHLSPFFFPHVVVDFIEIRSEAKHTFLLVPGPLTRMLVSPFTDTLLVLRMDIGEVSRIRYF